MSKFIIRQIAYHYSDENLYEHCEGGIIDIFKEKEKAESHYRRMEIAEFRAARLGDLPPIASCSTDKNGVREKLHDYFVKNFDEPLLTDHNGFKFAEVETYIPENATAEQIWEIKEMTGIRFYTLAEFEDKPIFYTLSIDGKLHQTFDNEFAFGENDDDEFVRNNRVIGAPYFYNSKKNALDDAINVLRYSRNGFEFKGSLNSLSLMPSLIESLITESECAKYDKMNEILKISTPERNSGEIPKFFAILELLKNNPIKIEEFSLDEAKEINHGIYEAM